MFSPWLVGVMTFVCVFAAAMIALALRRRIPEGHFSSDTKDTVKVATGIVGTMTGMLLGLLVASAKSSYDSQRNGVGQLAAQVIMLDRSLAIYGPETKPIREELKHAVEDVIHTNWLPDGASAPKGATEGNYEHIYLAITKLSPQTDNQKLHYGQIVKISNDIGQLRWSMYAQRMATIPAPLLVTMVCWLSLTFASFGLFSPANATAIIALIMCSLVVSSSILLILELDNPFSGLIQVSPQPLQDALKVLGR